MGKFSDPRNRFSGEYPQEPVDAPVPEEVPADPEPTPQAGADPVHEDEAIEETFRQVSAENPVFAFSDGTSFRC